MTARKNILIVEDDDDLRRVFCDALRYLGGFEVRGTGDGLEALQMIDAKRPDLVVLDLGLTTLDGVSVREELASNPRTKDIPIIVVTGTAIDHQLENVRVLRKPVTPEHLVLSVRTVLARTP